MAKKFRAQKIKRKEKDRDVWFYTCACPKIDGNYVGPFDLESLVDRVMNLHNVAEPNH